MADSDAKRDVPEPREQGPLREPRQVVRELVTAFARSGPAYHPIFEKLDSEHITQFLQQTHDQEKGERELQKRDQWFRLVYVLSGIFVFAFLTMFLLPDQADLYLRILEYFGVFAAGAGGGYGLKAYQDSRRDS